MDSGRPRSRQKRMKLTDSPESFQSSTSWIASLKSERSARTFDTAAIDDGPHGVAAFGGGGSSSSGSGSLATSELKWMLDLASRQVDIRARNDRQSSNHGNPMSGFYAQGWSEKDGERTKAAERRKLASGEHENQGQGERVHQGQDLRTRQEDEAKIRQESKTS
ncbi:hypothetical protein PHYSODRAFT_338693 [Phytophthora sojae]|uniref:Uncharacterized protein n=1 Tax=Phytophthora sojae (strain P6497) TaxID=1094619 RepID=G5A2V4_PHYSP|nr:hypothetical protein PHYSODRAFT_338693 [Phytophthora sojae]EGZ09994.1 hypothetical protein PHYSODRAFT_338693 [Phytophthora sojae]|eukprot:XP_009534855.1 hypothetical protein PHYSODRAFT_338693 [Phytophthora sojae]